MTFISTIIAKEGIVLSADSKELTQGGQLLWKDFDEILQLKKSHEDDTTLCISPKEITEKLKINVKLTKSRVKNKNDAKKIYQIDEYTAILISGVANPSKQEFQSFIEQIKNEIATSSDNSFTNTLNITFSTIEPLITNDKSEDRHSSELY